MQELALVRVIKEMKGIVCKPHRVKYALVLCSFNRPFPGLGGHNTWGKEKL